MALLLRRKAFCVISRYRSSGRLPFSCTSSSGSCSKRGDPAPSSSTTQMQSLQRLLPAMHSSSFTGHSLVPPRTYTTVATCLGGKHTSACCHTHKYTMECGCILTSTGTLHISARKCTTTTTAYPPPEPPREFQGGNEEAEADGAALHLDDEEGGVPMDGAEGFNMPPYDNSNYPEDDDGDYEDEDPPPDPEEKLLFSPSDED